MNLCSRIGAVIVGAVALVLLTVTSAAAASYDFAAPSGSGGAGTVDGTLNHTAYNSFVYNTYVADHCPADGYGVSFNFYMILGNGDGYNTGAKGWDTNGCDNGETHVSGSVTRPRSIIKTRVQMCFTDDGDLCAFVSTTTSGWKDNPHT